MEEKDFMELAEETRLKESLLQTSAVKPEEIVVILTYHLVGTGKRAGKYAPIMGPYRDRGQQIFIVENKQSNWSPCDASDWARGKDNEYFLQNAFDTLKEMLEQNNLCLEDVTTAYIFAGADSGGRMAIELSKQFTKAKTMYAVCGVKCEGDERIGLIKASNSRGKIRHCECGGRETLEDLLLERIYSMI